MKRSYILLAFGLIALLLVYLTPPSIHHQSSLETFVGKISNSEAVPLMKAPVIGTAQSPLSSKLKHEQRFTIDLSCFKSRFPVEIIRWQVLYSQVGTIEQPTRLTAAAGATVYYSAETQPAADLNYLRVLTISDQQKSEIFQSGGLWLSLTELFNSTDQNWRALHIDGSLDLVHSFSWPEIKARLNNSVFLRTMLYTTHDTLRIEGGQMNWDNMSTLVLDRLRHSFPISVPFNKSESPESDLNIVNGMVRGTILAITRFVQVPASQWTFDNIISIQSITCPNPRHRGIRSVRIFEGGDFCSPHPSELQAILKRYMGWFKQSIAGTFN